MENITFLNLEYFFLLIYNFFTGNHAVTMPISLNEFWINLSRVSTVVSLLLLSVILYAYLKLRNIRHSEKKKYQEILIRESPQERHDARWEKVEQLIASENENDWRQAIIEADVMLDDMLKNMGYPGDTVGERLKAIERSDFETLNDAWEAHKVRNEIAHGGLGYHLERRRVQSAIGMYRNVFKANFLI